MICRDVLGILTTPNQVAETAYEDDSARIEQAVLVGQMVDIATRSTADLAPALVVLPDRLTEELPLVRS